MAELKIGTLKLDSPRAVFYSGQVVTGSLEIELGSPLTFDVIYVRFLGLASVSWSEKETEIVNGNKRYKNVNYGASEEYFNVTELLAGTYGTISHLNPGKYRYPFRYQIPPGAPSSFRGVRGNVSYSVGGRVEFQGQVIHEMEQLFEVVAPFDLNKGNACVREPTELEFEEVVGCGCFGGSEPMCVRVRLPASGYCPGQVIPVAVEADNNSGVEITHVIYELLTRQKYKSQRPIAEYIEPEEVLSSVKKGSVMSGTKRHYSVELPVPDLIAPNLQDCNIIDVGYFFRVTIKLSGCNDDLQDEVEMCLGLVPLGETCVGTYVHPMAHSLPLEPVPMGVEPQTLRDAGTPQSFPAPQNAANFMQVHNQIVSPDPSQSYQLGFKVPYPLETQPSQFVQMAHRDATIEMHSYTKNQDYPPPYSTPVPSAPPL